MAQSKEIFFADLMDDYYAECEEHLAAIRRALLVVDAALGQDHMDRRPLDELFRSFHTIKGLSGMVGLREAEQLAHHVETFLRSLIKDLVPLTAVGMDTLLASIKLLEQVIAAHRLKKPMPDLKPVMDKLEGSVSSMNPPGVVIGPGTLPYPIGGWTVKGWKDSERLSRKGPGFGDLNSRRTPPLRKEASQSTPSGRVFWK